MKWLRLLLPLLLLGCGPAADLWLRVEGPFVVPGECDELLVEVAPTQGGAAIYQRTFPLTAAQQFPLTLSLYTQDERRLGPTSLTVHATARLGGEPVAPQAAADVTLRDGEVTPVTLQLSRPAQETAPPPAPAQDRHRGAPAN